MEIIRKADPQCREKEVVRMMKRLLMIAAMLLMAAIVLPPLARDQI